MLAKLFVRTEKTTDLHALREKSGAIVLPEVEPVFRVTGLPSALCKLYSKRGDDAARLEVLSKCVGSSPRRMPLFCLQLEPQTCRRRVDRYRDSRPIISYVCAAHGTAQLSVSTHNGVFD